MTAHLPNAVIAEIVSRVVARLHLRAGGFPRAMSGGAGESAASCRACPVNAGPASRGPSNDMGRANAPDAARDHFTGQGQQPLATISETRRPIHPAAGERGLSSAYPTPACGPRSLTHPGALPDGGNMPSATGRRHSVIDWTKWGNA